MNQKEIIEIITTKDNWSSQDLVNEILSQDKKQVKIKFCRIGGYELLKDGTQTETCKSLEEVQYTLDDWGIDYDETITDPIKLVKSVEDDWGERFNDGGGSGWIEY